MRKFSIAACHWSIISRDKVRLFRSLVCDWQLLLLTVVWLGVRDGLHHGAPLAFDAQPVQQQGNNGAQDRPDCAKRHQEEPEHRPAVKFLVPGQPIRNAGGHQNSHQGAEDEERHILGGPAHGDLAALSGSFFKSHAI